MASVSLANSYPGQPEPVPVGSPHWRMKMPESTNRWHVVLSKYPWSARETKEFTVHGALARSMVMVTSPSFIFSTYFTVPLVGTPAVDGGCTGFAGSPV